MYLSRVTRINRIFAALQPSKTRAASFIGDLPAVNPLAAERERRKVKRRKACKKGAARIAGERPRVRVSFDIQRGKYAISRSHKFSQSNERPFLSTRVAAALLMRVQQCAGRSTLRTCMHACTPTQNLESTPEIVYPGMPNTFHAVEKSSGKHTDTVMQARIKKKKRARVVDEIYGITKTEREIRENASVSIPDFFLLRIGAETNKRRREFGYDEYLI